MPGLSRLHSSYRDHAAGWPEKGESETGAGCHEGRPGHGGAR
jgi:hypothetical protein